MTVDVYGVYHVLKDAHSLKIKSFRTHLYFIATKYL